MIERFPKTSRQCDVIAMGWQLWQPGPIERQVGGISPLLASWERKSHPAQAKLRAYLDDLVGKLHPLPNDGPLFLRLEVDVGSPERLLRHYDLENFLTPMFGSQCLPSSRFVLVTAEKHVGGGSRVELGPAIPLEAGDEDDWSSFAINAGSGAMQKSWKERIRSELSAANPTVVPPGPARVRLAWRCSARRNWCSMWKPTGDAMGPVLGVANPDRPYHLDDDRIVELELHRNIDDTLGNDVEVGMWWRTASKCCDEPSILSQRAQSILNDALKLTPADRLFVAQELWSTLPPHDLPPIVIDDKLMAEIERRDAEMDAGHSISREEMMAFVRSSRRSRASGQCVPE